MNLKMIFEFKNIFFVSKSHNFKADMSSASHRFFVYMWFYMLRFCLRVIYKFYMWFVIKKNFFDAIKSRFPKGGACRPPCTPPAFLKNFAPPRALFFFFFLLLFSPFSFFFLLFPFFVAFFRNFRGFFAGFRGFRFVR